MIFATDDEVIDKISSLSAVPGMSGIAYHLDGLYEEMCETYANALTWANEHDAKPNESEIGFLVMRPESNEQMRCVLPVRYQDTIKGLAVMLAMPEDDVNACAGARAWIVAFGDE